MTNRVFIAGGGGIGRALGLLLLDEPSFPCSVTIGDAHLAAAREAAAFASAAGGEPRALEMPLEGTSDELARALDEADAILDGLPGSQAPRLARLAREHGCHYLNLTEYVRETEECLAIAEGGTTCFALQCGLAPGTINVLGHHLFLEACEEWGVDQVDHLRMRVGALPLSVRSPHMYGWTWSPAGVATEYVEPAIAVREFETVRLPSLSERETQHIEGLVLEEDLTSGGAADLPSALAGRVRNLDYKTFRHPGHYAWVENVIASLEQGPDLPIRLQAAMERSIPRCEDDQVVIYADVEGKDAAGNLRTKKAVQVVPALEIAGQRLRAIQSTTAAGIAEVLRLVIEGGLRGPLLQSQIPTGAYLHEGPFVRRAYGELKSL